MILKNLDNLNNSSNSYIFLDFDGVLHTHLQTGKDRFSQTDALVKLIKSLKEKTSGNCHIIFTTSWRNHFSVDELTDCLQLKSQKLVDIVSVASFNVTPNLPFKSRYLEIKKYCLDNNIDITGTDKTQHIVILDDVEDLFTDEHGINILKHDNVDIHAQQLKKSIHIVYPLTDNDIQNILDSLDV